MWTLGLLTGISWIVGVSGEDYSGSARNYYTNYYKNNEITTGAYTSTQYENTEKQHYEHPASRRLGTYRRRPLPIMPECAAQQVCNAIFMRLKYVQPLCKCALSFHDPCSSRMTSEDGHTINLIADRDGTQSQTLVKVCEDVTAVKPCHDPHDWMLLALQNIRTGKAHYLVVCRCPSNAVMEGPVLHTNPPYARVPGISVYGMLCVQGARKSRLHKTDYPPIPWDKVYELQNATMWTKPARKKYHSFSKHDIGMELT